MRRVAHAARGHESYFLTVKQKHSQKKNALRNTRSLSHLVHLIVVVQPEEEEAYGVADRLSRGDLVAEEDRREEHQPRLKYLSK